MKLKTLGIVAFLVFGLAWLLMRPLVVLLRERAPPEDN